jgi:surface antigen
VGNLGKRPATWPQRTIARTLASVCVAGGLLSLAAPAAHAEDDYPWAWQGQCPVVPQAPIEEPTPTPTPTPEPVEPGGQAGDKAGEKPEPAAETPPPPEPVLDPVSGHLYDPRGPKPTCAKWVWSINGSIGDPWGFVWRNCTSFVAWRMQERNRMAGFSNHFGGQHWGNAEHWDDAARALGYRVDSVPAIGAVAQTDAGRVGHVAWVTAIGAGTVTIEEYNHSLPGGYGTRTVPVGDFRYLHLDDVAPSPLVGSDRPVVSVPDGLGESWTARVDDAGTLRVAHPGRRARVVGPRGGFSPVVAAALTLDRRGRPWVAATTRDGRVLAGTVRGTGFALRTVGAAAPTSSPALTLSRTGRPVVAAVSPSGTLVTRRFTEQRRWSRSDRVGRPASWATHTAPVLGADGSGRTWLVAVTANGATYAQWLERGRLVRLAGPTASTTSTPALTVSGGTARLHQVGADGRLTVRTLRGRRWGRAAALDGDWSPYSSPAVGEVAGRLVVAAVDRRGTLRLRTAVDGRHSRLAPRLRTAGDPTRSPGLVTRRNGGVFVVSLGARRAPQARLLTRPATAVSGDTSPTRGGFTP